MTEQSPQNGLVIIGSGLAGYTLAREFRKRDGATKVTVITGDDGAMYSKPMLSAALAQNKTPEALVQKAAEVVAKELDITVLTHTRVLEIDRNAKRLQIVGPTGEAAVGYDRLVLAVGASSRKFPIEGDDAIPVAAVNSLEDYRRWREAIGAKGRILLIGGGLIGSEFANDLTAAGFKVELVDPAPWPLARLLPENFGRAMASAFANQGIGVRFNDSVARLSKVDGQRTAELVSGARVAFDHALMAVGVVPNTNLASAAGLEIGAGVRVDSFLRTNDRSIYALGDCAETDAGPMPFVLPLMAQARALAATLAGEETRLSLPALPVVVKTPLFPVAVCPPPAQAKGEWIISGAAEDGEALFHDEEGETVGFVLTGGQTARRQALAKDMPALL